MNPHHPNTPSTLNLRLAYWNANGVLNKRLELTDFLHKNNLDAILINETHLQPEIKFFIPCFRTYRTDRLAPSPLRSGRIGGGTAILVKSSLSHSYTPIPTQLIESTTILLNTTSGPLKLIAAYSPPKIMIPPQEIATLFKEDIPTLLAGDLNAKHPTWNSRIKTPKGNALLRTSKSLHIDIIGPTSPTMYPLDRRKKPDVLDITLTKALPYFLHLNVDSDLGSDHSAVIITLTIPSCSLLPDKPPPVRVDWKGYRRTLAERTPTSPPFHTPQEIDSHVQNITNIISSALQKNSHPIKPHPKCPNIPPELADLILQKRKARRRWRATGYRPFKSEYNRLSRTIKNLTRSHRDREWREKLESLSTKDNSLWDFFRIITKKHPFTPPLTDPVTNNIASTSHQKALLFQKLTSKIHNPDMNNIPPSHIHLINKTVEEYLLRRSIPSDIPFSKIDLINIIDSSNPKKAPGPDGIAIKALQLMPDPTVHYLHLILASAYSCGHFPTNWKEAHTVMIPKPGKPLTNPSSYRPISLLNSMSKIYEKLLLHIMHTHSSTHNINIPQQAGFTAHTSTIHQLTRLTNHIHDGFRSRKVTVATFLDVERAFDRVWHQGLLFKLISLNFPRNLILSTQSFLKSRSFRIKTLNALSPPGTIAAGVPQGSVLSPFLFNLYLNDIPQLPTTKIFLYADDTVITSQFHRPSKACAALNHHLSVLDNWFQKWNIKPNPLKSQATIFYRNRRYQKKKPIAIAGSKIPWTRFVTYLGVTLDKELRWNRHISKRKATASRCVNRLFPLLKYHSPKTLTNALLLYKAVLRPFFSYGHPLWINCSPSNRKSINSFQSKILRCITDSPRFMKSSFLEADLKIPPLTTYLDASAKKFYDSLPSHSNSLYKGLVQQMHPENPPGLLGRKTKKKAKTTITSTKKRKKDKTKKKKTLI